jgi:hypothetical protein
LFFTNQTAERIVHEDGKASIVFARNVLPHVANPRDFVEGLSHLVTDEGIVVIEVHYAKIILEELHYDSIYHEHLCYFTLKTLEKLLNLYGLFLFDLSQSPISGGSIVVYASKIKRTESKKLQNTRMKEQKERINSLSSWEQFATRARDHKERFVQLINKAASKGIISAYGASARSSTLLNYCKISANQISVIADKNPLKQGLYTAGSHILIDTPHNALAKSPSTIIILAWNFVDEIREVLKTEFDYHGSYIIPLPNKPYTVNV